MSIAEVPDRELTYARQTLAAWIEIPQTCAQITAEIVAAMGGTFPGYADLVRTAPDDVRQSVGAHVRTILGCLATGRTPRPGEVTALAAVGARRQAQGVPLDQLLRAHTFGATMLLELTLEKVRRLPVGRATLEAMEDDARRILLNGSRMITDAFSDHAVAAQAAVINRAAEEALGALLAGAPDAKSLARAAGFEPDRFHTVAVFGALDPACREIEPKSMLGSLREVFPDERTTLVAMHQTAGVAVRAHPEIADADGFSHLVRDAIASSALRSCVLAGIGGSVERVDGIHESFDGACEVLELLRSRPALPRVMDLEAASPLLMLLQSPRHARVVAGAIAPLLGSNPAEQAKDLDTLDALLDTDGSVAAVAGALGVCERTARRRMKLIRRRLDESPALRNDSLLVNLGRRAVRMFSTGLGWGSAASPDRVIPERTQCPLSGQSCQKVAAF